MELYFFLILKDFSFEVYVAASEPETDNTDPSVYALGETGSLCYLHCCLLQPWRGAQEQYAPRTSRLHRNLDNKGSRSRHLILKDICWSSQGYLNIHGPSYSM